MIVARARHEWICALALAGCGEPFAGEIFAEDGAVDAAAVDSAPDGEPDATDADALPPDAEPDAACECEHMPYVGSGDQCGPSFSCSSVGENTCWRCPCDAAEAFYTTCLKVGDDGAHQWWCCS